MRSFTSGKVVSKALKWARKGTTQDVQWVEHQVESSVDRVPELAKTAINASVEFVIVPYCFLPILIWWRGDSHESLKSDGSVDPWHASGIIESASGTTLTSYDAYSSGLVVFSKRKYGQVQLPVAESSSSQTATTSASSPAQGVTSLTGRTNEQTQLAEWWDGTEWIEGNWSDEYQK